MNEKIDTPGPRPRVLIVDDEIGFIQRATRLLGGEYELDAAHDWAGAKKLLDRKTYDVMLLDFDLKDGMDGLDIIENIGREGPASLATILISKFMRKDLERAGYEKGAYYCMNKALDDDEMKRQISNAITRNLEYRELLAKARDDRDSQVSPIFNSGSMRAILDRVAQYLKTDANILITGEKGTGKGVFAEWIHRNSSRSGAVLTHVFVPNLQQELMNAELFGHMKGAFPGADDMPGLLEVSHKGTMILDEIADLDIGDQAKFLKMMQEKTFRRVRGVKDIPFDVRFISITNHPDLDEEVRLGKLRGDLLDRLRPCHVHMPPLRERREDIPELAADLLSSLSIECGRQDIEGFEDGLMRKMLDYSWPGNVRELEHWIRSGILNAYGSRIRISDVEKSIKVDDSDGSGPPFQAGWHSLTLEEVTREAQKTLVEHVLSDTGGRMKDAAGRLGIHRVNLYKLCDRLGIDHKKYKDKKKS